MRHPLLVSTVAPAAGFVFSLFAQAPAAAPNRAGGNRLRTAPRTAAGQTDLQDSWTQATVTPQK